MFNVVMVALFLSAMAVAPAPAQEPVIPDFTWSPDPAVQYEGSSSDPLEQTVNSRVLAITGGDHQTAPINNAFASPLQVTLTGSDGLPAAGLAVTFTPNLASGGASAVLSSGTATTDESGIASVTATANAQLGAYTVTASAPGASPVSFTLTNARVGTTTELVSSPNPSNYGKKVTFTATVASADLNVTPTGAVILYEQFPSGVQAVAEGLTAEGAAAQANAAEPGVLIVTFTVSTLSGGDHLMVAEYQGDANTDASAGTRLHTVRQAPIIVMQPADLTVNAGEDATFTAEALGGPAPTVQWQASTDGGAIWSDIEGAVETTLTLAAVQPAQNGYQYRAVFTNPSGSATSDAAALTVYWAPAIPVQPANQTVNPGATATFTAAADANPPAAVRWQVSMDGGANWTDIEGATSTTLTLANVALSQNSHQYRAVFTNEVGSACTDAWPTSA